MKRRGKVKRIEQQSEGLQQQRTITEMHESPLKPAHARLCQTGSSGTLHREHSSHQLDVITSLKGRQPPIPPNCNAYMDCMSAGVIIINHRRKTFVAAPKTFTNKPKPPV